MSDERHERFEAWIADGAPGEPPRDAALHASVCEGCLSLVAARDALAAIDTGRAALPPSRLMHRAAPRPIVRVFRTGLATAAVVMLGAALRGLASSDGQRGATLSPTLALTAARLPALPPSMSCNGPPS